MKIKIETKKEILDRAFKCKKKRPPLTLEKLKKLRKFLQKNLLIP